MLESARLFDVLMKASAALVTLGFGAVILRQAPGRHTNRFLAAFLFLISANQLMETWITLQKVEAEIGWLAALVPPMSQTGLHRLALVFAAADPFVLYYFASIYPRRSALNHIVPVMAVFAASALFLASAHGYVLERDIWISFMWEAFTAVVYLVVWFHFARPLARGGGGPGARAMFYAMSVAALPLIPRVGRSATRLVDLTALGTFLEMAPAVVPIVVMVVALVAIDHTRWRSADGAFTRAAALSGVVMVVGFLPWFARFLPAVFAPAAIALPWYSASAALRWIIFSLVVSVAVFRHDILGMRVESRRRAARGAVMFAGAFALIFIYAALNVVLAGGPVRLRLLDMLLIVAVAALSPDVRRFVQHKADRLYGVPPVADRRATADTYRTAVVQAQQDGRVIAMDSDLARLRRSLGVDPETAEWLESSAIATAAPRSLETGSMFQGRYRVGRFIGRGGSGRVFVARDPLLNRDVVLKEVQETTRLQGQRLLEEAQAAARVRHPHVVAVHDVVPQTGRVVMVTELMRTTLDEHVQRHGPLGLDDAIRLFSGVASGLEAIHEAGVLHRDLKPANIFLSESGRVAKIGDFGVAVDVTPVTLAAGTDDFAGTVGFLAPEVLEGGELTPRLDIYALGKTIERCVDDHARHALADVIAKATCRDPESRYSSASAMLRALRAVATNSGDQKGDGEGDAGSATAPS